MPDAEKPPMLSPFTATANYSISFALILLVAIGALIVYHRSEPAVHAIDGYTMGSTWSVRFTAPAHADVNAVRTQLEQLLAELDLALSGYREDSALARLNTAPVGQWIDIPQHLGKVLLFGLELWRESGGAFDMTVKPLVSHNLASVTVLAPGKLTADGYATAIMVLGEEKGLVFADAHRLPVFIIGRRDDGTFYRRYNHRFASYLATD